jgi:hypothetical protein
MPQVDLTRLRWRLRGAWQWPAFLALTVAEAVLLNVLPVWGDGVGGAVPGMLLAVALNLIVVAALAPLFGMLLRRRRRDLPRAIATDYAGTVLLGLLALALVAGGVGHRSALQHERAARTAAIFQVAHYVRAQEPAYRSGLNEMDTLRVEDDMYRACVTGADPDRPLCLFVRTDQSPPGVTEDPDRAPNSAYRSHGGFQ